MEISYICYILPLLLAVAAAFRPDEPGFGVTFVNGTVDPDFKCYHEFGYYADPRNCQAYYECSHWEPVHMWCPPGLWWHPILKTCHWPQHTPGCYADHHHTYFFIPDYFNEIWDEGGSWNDAEIVCDDIYFPLVSIETAGENEFLKEAAKRYEHDYWNDTHVYFWSSGKRNAHGHFRWVHPQPHKFTVTDWCNNHPKAIHCDPDNQKKECLVLDTHYDGWWNAAKCDMEAIYICEAPNSGGHTTRPPTPPTTTEPTPPTTTTTEPTTTTTTEPPTTTQQPRPPTTELPDEEFLHWFNCYEESVHGFCENYYTCDPDTDGNIIKHKHACPEGTLFNNDKDVMKCVDIADFEGDYCDSPPNLCIATGIFPNKRNCGRFYACTETFENSGEFIQKDYSCPDGYLFYQREGVCIPSTEDPKELSLCPFDYQIPDPVDPDDSTQCSSEDGRIAYDDPDWPGYEDDFIICQTYGDNLGQLGPFYCPKGTIFRNKQCEIERCE